MERTVAFYTLGCKVNQYETNAMEQQFIQNGYKIVENTEKAEQLMSSNDIEHNKIYQLLI